MIAERYRHNEVGDRLQEAYETLRRSRLTVGPPGYPTDAWPELRREWADLIIAVHASAGRERDARDTVEKGMIAIHHRVTDIMAHARREVVEDSWLGPPVIDVRPRVEAYSTFDFDAVDFFLAEGYRAAAAALAAAN